MRASRCVPATAPASRQQYQAKRAHPDQTTTQAKGQGQKGQEIDQGGAATESQQEPRLRLLLLLFYSLLLIFLHLKMAPALSALSFYLVTTGPFTADKAEFFIANERANTYTVHMKPISTTPTMPPWLKRNNTAIATILSRRLTLHLTRPQC